LIIKKNYRVDEKKKYSNNVIKDEESKEKNETNVINIIDNYELRNEKDIETLNNKNNINLNISQKRDIRENFYKNTDKYSSIEMKNSYNSNRKSKIISNVIELNSINYNMKNNWDMNMNIPPLLLEKLEKEGIISFENSPINHKNYRDNEIDLESKEINDNSKFLTDFKTIEKKTEFVKINTKNNYNYNTGNNILIYEKDNNPNENPSQKFIFSDKTNIEDYYGSIFIKIDPLLKTKNKKSLFIGDTFSMELENIQLEVSKKVVI